MTFEKTTIIGTSTESFTAAADDAIDRAEDQHERVMWAEVEPRGVEVANAADREYQVEAVIAYEVA